jgi:hypothetical protein
MAPRREDAIMTSFKEAKVDLLVATTVDRGRRRRANASLMGDRGTPSAWAGAAASAAWARSVAALPKSHVRVALSRAAHRIARERHRRHALDQRRLRDLATRPGSCAVSREMLGTRQTGLMQMRVADLGARRRPAAAGRSRGIDAERE